MNKYLFDTNTIIGLGQRHYPIDIFPDLWERIYSDISDGTILISDGVIQELKDKIDDTSANRNAWRQRLIQLAEEAPAIAHGNYQTEYARIANKCNSDVAYKGNCQISKISRFLEKADVWLVSIAKVEGYILVSEETEGSLKIPTVCRLEDITCISTTDYYRSLGLRFSIQ